MSAMIEALVWSGFIITAMLIVAIMWYQMRIK
jgi:hypothetical protein